MTIHWCGTGLSAIPGLRQLITSGHDVIVGTEQLIRLYQRSVDSLKEFDIQKLRSSLKKVT